MRTTEQKFNALFSELVPVTGNADTVAGEIIRAVSRISYRYYNDGDRIGIGYGKETCNPAARYLIKNGGDEVAVIVRGFWEVRRMTYTVNRSRCLRTLRLPISNNILS